MEHILGFKEGASFLNIDTDPTQDQVESFSWEKNVTSGKGWSYGAEFLLQKKSGKLSGWIGYTLSWTQMQFDSLNFGNKFYARYDRRHDISLVGIYKLRKESAENGEDGITLSATWVYGTGNAITLPISSFIAPNHNPAGSDMGGYWNSQEYSEKNAYRMAAYHRLDFGIQFHRTKKHGVRTWEFSIYNVYSRQNPYFYFVESNNGRNFLTQVSLFPILPSFSYSFKFMKTKARKVDKVVYEQ